MSSTSMTRVEASTRMMSPSSTSAMGPPTCASGVTWPTTNPCEPPENRPAQRPSGARSVADTRRPCADKCQGSRGPPRARLIRVAPAHAAGDRGPCSGGGRGLDPNVASYLVYGSLKWGRGRGLDPNVASHLVYGSSTEGLYDPYAFCAGEGEIEGEGVLEGCHLTIGEERALLPEAGAHDGAGRGEHLGHAGPPLGPLVADHDHRALELGGVLAQLREHVLLAVKAEGGALEEQA
eukprot:1184467-Prorocentrum_minimum.AAC.3